jgi:hypothetical protein
VVETLESPIGSLLGSTFAPVQVFTIEPEGAATVVAVEAVAVVATVVVAARAW